MDETHARCLLLQGFEGECYDGRGVAALFYRFSNCTALEVGEIDGTFFCACEDADDAAEAGGVLEEWEEVLNEADAGVD